VHLGHSHQLGYSLARCGKHFQFGVKRGHISKTLCSKWGHIFTTLFVHFFTFESPLFYNHHSRESNVTIIPSTMGTHQGDHLGGHYSL